MLKPKLFVDRVLKLGENLYDLYDCVSTSGGLIRIGVDCKMCDVV